MAEAVGQFSVANQPESELFTFDFVNDLAPSDSLASAGAWSCAVAIGVDPNAATRLTGSPTAFGTRTTQRGAGFLPGVTYVLTATVPTANGNTLTLWAYLPCEVIGC